MKVIKFRQWDKIIKEMDEMRNILVPVVKENDARVLMQFTGLKDKNGVEIYEGDVILAGKDKICEVVFDDCSFSLRCFENKNFPEMHIALSKVDSDFIEAIGNIYENPELLEDNE